MPTVNGLVVMKPTSIASTGTGNSSSIGANGKVTFSSCATLRLDSIFSSAYDNYVIVPQFIGSIGNDAVNIRLSNAGTVTTDSNYTYQYLSALGASIGSGVFGSQSAGRIGNSHNVHGTGDHIYIYGPYLAQTTNARSVNVFGFDGVGIVDFAWYHTTASSYDGIWLQAAASTISGNIVVYGFNQ